MADRSPTHTSITLLMRVRDLEDQQAWDQFVELYAPRIFSWCRQHKLQESDAADITQEVLLKLVGALQAFQYDPARGSFRSWLRTVTVNAIRNVSRSWKKPGRGSGDSQVLTLLASLEDASTVDDLTARLEAAYRDEIRREAETRVKLRVQQRTWSAYEMTAVGQVRPAEVAQRLGMPVSEVYVAKSRVIKLLRQEVHSLNGLP